MKPHYFIFPTLILFSFCTPDDPCEPEITKVYPELYDLLPDTYFSSLPYTNSNGVFIFDTMNYGLETVSYHCEGSESFSLVYGNKNNDYSGVKIIYYLLCEPSRNVHIKIGNDGSFQCGNDYFLNSDSLGNYTHFDTLTLNNVLFYDVYHRTGNFSCASDLYYNKQYGVVGFKWFGEWFVLETDSL